MHKNHEFMGKTPTSQISRKPAAIDLDSVDDGALLDMRICDLPISIQGTVIEDRIGLLYSELADRGVPFQPTAYLADEWLTPDGCPVIGIPFFLAHPRLMQLERKMMLEVEGGTESWCMQLLRHETGHALNNAYCFYRKTRWRTLFGASSQDYNVNAYMPRPYSKKFVVHLQDHYAQSHPDEDYAETFAVWLDPKSRWQTKYRDWPALKKLRYIDHLMRTLPPRPAVKPTGERPWAAATMKSTLRTYYRRRRSWLEQDFPGFYDGALKRIFTPRPGLHNAVKASRFLRRQKRQIINGVARWTGGRKYDVNGLIVKLARRCDEMSLYLTKEETLIETVALITTVISNPAILKRRLPRP